MNSTPRRLALIAPYSRLAVVPSLIALMQALVRQGYGLDLYAWQDWRELPPLAPLENVRLFLLPQTAWQGRGAWRWQFLRRWLPYLGGQLRRERNCGVVGVDHWGLLLAVLTTRLHRIPVIYLSLELYFRDELASPFHKLLKWAERWGNRAAALTLIQDQDRGDLLMAENGLGPERIAFLPNGWWDAPQSGKTDYIRRTLGLKTGRTIVLYAGSIDEWTETVELAKEARSWPEDWAMVFHAPGPLESEYERAFLRQIDGVQTYLLQARMDLEQLLEMIRGADIGVALHRVSETEKNVFTLGLSSGKIALYLHGGLPLVTTGLPTIRKFVEPYGCGLCVDRADEVAGAIRAILPQYDDYSRNARRCYREEFAVDRYLEEIFRRLTKLVG